jgi:signal transduction histidine kinase
VTNAIRHGRHVTRLDVALTRTHDHLTLDIRNDGTEVPHPPGRGGLGLRSMAQRAAAIGGSLTAQALPQGGYHVRAVL